MRKCYFVMIAFAAMIASAVVPQRVRKVVLVVQNLAAQGTSIPTVALTKTLTTKLSGADFEVIDPYNSVGVNQNRNALGEKTPAVSTMELARQLNADGVITASVIEFLDTAVGEPTAPKKHQYSMRVALNLADAWTGATVCGETMAKDSPKYFNSQIVSNRQKYLGDLLYAATDACAERLLSNPRVRGWEPTPRPSQPPSDTRSEFDKVVDKLTDVMLSDSNFWMEYNKLKENLGRKPRALIGGMKNKSGRPDFDAGLEVAGKRFLKKLYDSAKFDVLPDDQIVTDIAERLVKAVGPEKDDLIDELKQHGSPDLYVVWELIHSADPDGTGYYNFVLTISHLRKPGGVFWTSLDTLKMSLKDKKEMSR